MNPETPAVHNPLEVMQAGEQVVCEIKRHPIGIMGIYVTVGFLLVVLAVLIYVVAPSIFSGVSHNQIFGIGSIVLLIVAVLGIGFAFISQIIYWGNRWVVTTDSVTQVQQTSLFNKQSSQLSLENLEDVTVEQVGPLAQMLGFGLLRCETAGERSKFLFPYCPNPNQYAREILNARERFMQDIRTKEAGRLQYQDAPPQAPGPAEPSAGEPQ